ERFCRDCAHVYQQPMMQMMDQSYMRRRSQHMILPKIAPTLDSKLYMLIPLALPQQAHVKCATC
ncbi:unnamed protein product, partial [Ilex paraguariensis]